MCMKATSRHDEAKVGAATCVHVVRGWTTQIAYDLRSASLLLPLVFELMEAVGYRAKLKHWSSLASLAAMSASLRCAMGGWLNLPYG